MGNETCKIANGGGKLYPFGGIWPQIADNCFIAAGARIIGDVKIGTGSSIWFNVVIRGDVGSVIIGENSNIQDGSVIHVSSGGINTHIGDDVLIGHMAMIHGTTIENGGFVGFNAATMDNSRICARGMLAAGSLLSPGKTIGKEELWMGRPAKLVRELDQKMLKNNQFGSKGYAKLAQKYLSEYLNKYSKEYTTGKNMSANSPSFLGRLFWWLPFGSAPETSSEELKKKLKNKKSAPQLLDVRTEKEWLEGHIAGAINIPITELKSKLESLSFDKKNHIVAICLSAHRSIPAVRLLSDNGYENVTQLGGGMNAWRSCGHDEDIGG